MKHLKSITIPMKASIIVDDPDTGGDDLNADDIVAIMESFFGFVFDFIEIKGKGESA